MSEEINRRVFLRSAMIVGAGATLLPLGNVVHAAPGKNGGPLVIASGNGMRATEKAMEMIRAGVDALDAVIGGVNIIEDDPNDMSVGYGGLPNEEGIVELDASVMHGPSHCAGAVAALRNIKNPSKVAKVVMERTDHVLLVGEGALKFARMHGFKEENLLTDKAREEWVKWKENLSKEDDYLPPHSINDTDIGYNQAEIRFTYGTINCLGLDLQGNLSGVTTTSGLSYKIPGRVGDSPIIGAGLYVDNAVGAAGSTGRGEANLTNCSSVMIVEFMREGLSPDDACKKACERIVLHTLEKRLLNKQGRPSFNVNFYAMNKQGEFGACSLWSGATYALHDGKENRLLQAKYLFQRG